MALAGIEILFTIPLACYAMYVNLSLGPLPPYVSWDYAHTDFGAIEQVPSVVWKQTEGMITGFEMTRYSTVLVAVIFFAFFGFADEARRNYRLAYVSVAKRVGLSTGSISATGTWTANGYVNELNPDSHFGSAQSHASFSSRIAPTQICPTTAALPPCLSSSHTRRRRSAIRSRRFRLACRCQITVVHWRT